MSERGRARVAAGTGLSLGAALGMGTTAQAADFTVTSTASSGGGSLSQAVTDSETTGGPDRVLFQAGLTGTITLSSMLSVTQPLEILGPGAGSVTVSGNSANRVINIDTAVGDDVKISGLSLINGHSTSDGGVISTVDGDLTIVSSRISGGTALTGAGVYSNLGTVSIQDSTVEGNTATGSGGGIYSLDADLEVIGSTVSGNGAPANGAGGGIKAEGASTLVQASTVSGNSAGNGGGIHGFNTDVGLKSSTISGNTATGTGGGSGYGYGGGIWLDTDADGSLISYGATIAANHAALGGGISADVGSNGFGATVIADNTATSGPDLRTAGPDPFNFALSLVESTSGATVADINPFIGSNSFGVDPQLGPLAANGGPTMTMKPALTSPLIDQGLNVGGPSDQRGLTRPFDVPAIANSTAFMADATDIGAVELQAADFAPPVTTPQPAPSPAKGKCAKKKGKGRAAAAKKKKKCKKKRKKR